MYIQRPIIQGCSTANLSGPVVKVQSSYVTYKACSCVDIYLTVTWLGPFKNQSTAPRYALHMRMYVLCVLHCVWLCNSLWCHAKHRATPITTPILCGSGYGCDQETPPYSKSLDPALHINMQFTLLPSGSRLNSFRYIHYRFRTQALTYSYLIQQTSLL